MDEPKAVISAEEVSNYVVCPEAWRLKYLGKGQKQFTERTGHVRQLRKEWMEQQLLSTRLRAYAKIAYLLLVAVAIVVFLLEHKRITTRSRPGLPVIQEEANTPQ